MSPDRLREKIEPLFRDNFERHGELGAALSIWRNGVPLLELHGGFRDAHRTQPWTPDTLVLVWSATKGIGSACLLHALQENRIDLSRRVSDFWPEFGQNGKAEITIATLMSHAAGLCALDEPANLLEYGRVIAALEQQKPLWSPANGHGYHARTFGFLIDELTRRLTGLPISQYWRTHFGEPLKLDFWIGLPNELNDRVATIYAARAGGPAQPAQFYRDLNTRGTLQQRVFSSPGGLLAVSAMNKPEIRAQPIVSLGGIGSVSALAKFYAIVANGGMAEGRQYFHPTTLAWMSARLQDGQDKVLEIPTAFSAGFMMDASVTSLRIFGPNHTAFGHPGAGGSHIFADPSNRIAFAYVMNRMEQSVLPTEKALRLVQALYNR